jgi:hypothetical protein
MGGLYDILESYRDQQNRLNYEGLYEEPADTSINLDPMYNIGARQFGDMRMGMPQVTGIMQQAPVNTQNFEFLSSAYENEDDQQVDYLPGQPKSFRDSGTLQEYFQNRNPLSGIMNLLGNIPTPFNLVRKGLGALTGLNKNLRGTTFALSPTLKDYFAAKKAEKKAAAGADVGVSGGGRGSRRGDADIAGSDRGGFATDDTAGFF